MAYLEVMLVLLWIQLSSICRKMLYYFITEYSRAGCKSAYDRMNERYQNQLLDYDKGLVADWCKEELRSDELRKKLDSFYFKMPSNILWKFLMDFLKKSLSKLQRVSIKEHIWFWQILLTICMQSNVDWRCLLSLCMVHCLISFNFKMSHLINLFDTSLTDERNDNSVCLVFSLVWKKLLLSKIFGHCMVVPPEPSANGEQEDQNLPNQLPKHFWRPREGKTVDGKTKWFVNLEIGSYVFGRYQDRPIGGLATFSCLECDNIKPRIRTYAKARKVSISPEGLPIYELVQAPLKTDHSCSPLSTNPLKHDFIPKCKNLIKSTLKKQEQVSVGNVYKQVRQETLEPLTSRQKDHIAVQIPTFEQCNGNLYTYRSDFFPTEPKTAAEFDTKAEWLLFKDEKESMVKAEETMENGKRIILFSSEENLQNLADSIGLSCDGTFLVTPKVITE